MKVAIEISSFCIYFYLFILILLLNDAIYYGYSAFNNMGFIVRSVV